MAITETRQYREPFVEAAGLGVTNEGLRLLKQTLPTATYTGSQFVAGQVSVSASGATVTVKTCTKSGCASAEQLTGTISVD